MYFPIQLCLRLMLNLIFIVYTQLPIFIFIAFRGVYLLPFKWNKDVFLFMSPWRSFLLSCAWDGYWIFIVCALSFLIAFLLPFRGVFLIAIQVRQGCVSFYVDWTYFPFWVDIEPFEDSLLRVNGARPFKTFRTKTNHFHLDPVLRCVWEERLTFWGFNVVWPWAFLTFKTKIFPLHWCDIKLIHDSWFFFVCF